MKKNLHLLSLLLTPIFFLLLSFTTQAQLPSYIPTNGLVGWWPFNGNANDLSGNGNNGTITGATLTTDRLGNSNGAYFFDPNIVSSILITTPSNLTNNFSMVMWVKSNRILNSQTESNLCPGSVSVPMANSNQNWAYEPAEGQPNIGVGFSIGTNGIFVAGHSTNLLVNHMSVNAALNGFTCVGIVYRSDSAFLYLNGDLSRSKPIYCSSVDKILSSTFKLGSALYSPNFSGIIDEYGLWSRALSANEIAVIYAGNSGNVGVNIAIPKRNLHVNNTMRLEPRDTAPDNPSKGDMYFDGLINKLRVYDGTTWQNCW